MAFLFLFDVFSAIIIFSDILKYTLAVNTVLKFM